MYFTVDANVRFSSWMLVFFPTRIQWCRFDWEFSNTILETRAVYVKTQIPQQRLLMDKMTIWKELDLSYGYCSIKLYI